MGSDNTLTKTGKRKSLLSEIWKHRYLYILLLPGLLYFTLFKYFPIAWLGIAFQDFKLMKGITGSEFVGLKHFYDFFSSPDCWMVIKNTIVLNLYSIVFDFPTAIIFALFVNEVRAVRFKKTIQTISYLPHFISTVVLVGLINSMLSSLPPGPVFKLVSMFTGTNTSILGNESFFRPVYTISTIWKQTGWNAIIYIAALANIDPTYYEAATVDGAGRLRQLIHITIPCISTTIIMMLIIKVGQIMTVGFEKAYLMGSDTTRQVSEIISTYTYKRGMADGDYSYATAVGLFNSTIGLILTIIFNRLSRRVSEYSMW